MSQYYSDKIPYGYKLVGDHLELDELRSEIISWLYATSDEYTKNPPAVLVEGVINRYQEDYNEQLTYEAAKEMVSHGDILNYITKEHNEKVAIFNNGDDKSVEALKAILALPREDAASAYKAILPEIIESMRHQKNYMISKVETTKGNHNNASLEPIVSKELFDDAQAKMEENQLLDQSGPVM